MKPFVKSWKSTSLAVIAFLLALLLAIRSYIDDDPATVPDWNTAVEAGIALVVAVLAFLTRDADTSSRESGIL